MRVTAREADAVTAAIRRQVVEFGWAAVAVYGAPPFAYTAGLWRMVDHPELVITGLPAETAKWVLDRAVERIRSGRTIQPGSAVPGLIGE